MAMMWIAYDPSDQDDTTNREQFNGAKPAWGESYEDFIANHHVDVPLPGDMLSLRMGTRVVDYRRLECPEADDGGNRITDWYWTVIVK
jgi:hypothetical protein